MGRMKKSCRCRECVRKSFDVNRRLEQSGRVQQPNHSFDYSSTHSTRSTSNTFNYPSLWQFGFRRRQDRSSFGDAYRVPPHPQSPVRWIQSTTGEIMRHRRDFGFLRYSSCFSFTSAACSHISAVPSEKCGCWHPYCASDQFCHFESSCSSEKIFAIYECISGFVDAAQRNCAAMN